MATPPYPNPYGKGNEPSAPPGQGYPGYGQQPPPPPSYSQPPANYQQPPPTSSYGYQQQPGGYHQTAGYQQPKVQKSHGLLGSLGGIGRDLAKGVNSVASGATTMYSKSVHGDILSQLQSGTVVVLISRMSGRSLQIVQASDGRLIADAACQDSPHIYNNKWTVIKRPAYHLFSNYNNYLAIDNGQLFIVTGISDPNYAPPAARFKLSQTEHFIMLESAIASRQYVAANERGEIKPPVAATNDKYSHFGVQFCSYQPAR